MFLDFSRILSISHSNAHALFWSHHQFFFTQGYLVSLPLTIGNSLCRILAGVFAVINKARPLLKIVEKPTSTRWLCCSVALAVCSNCTVIFHLEPFNSSSNFLFSPAFSHLMNFTSFPVCFPLLNLVHVGQ